MLINILIFILSIIPSVFIVVWMMRRKKDDPMYRKSCRSALIRGLISPLPILAFSMTLYILSAVAKFFWMQNVPELLYQAIYKFVVLALAEEIIKYVCFRFLLRKKFCAYSWADIVAFMVIIGTLFGLLEDIPYAVDATPIVMLVRGFTMGHVGYAFLMGWFYGKRLYSGKKVYGVLALIVPWLLHGLYDFSLTPELLELNDNLAFIGVLLALLDIALIVLMICFFIRSKKIDRYNQPLIETEH